MCHQAIIATKFEVKDLSFQPLMAIFSGTVFMKLRNLSSLCIIEHKMINVYRCLWKGFVTSRGNVPMKIENRPCDFERSKTLGKRPKGFWP